MTPYTDQKRTRPREAKHPDNTNRIRYISLLLCIVGALGFGLLIPFLPFYNYSYGNGIGSANGYISFGSPVHVALCVVLLMIAPVAGVLVNYILVNYTNLDKHD